MAITAFGLTTTGSSLGENLVTEFATVANNEIISIIQPSTLNISFITPSMSLEYQASTFIYTKASPIVINEDPIQTWYMS